MKLFPVLSVLVGTAAFTLGQLIEIAAPVSGSVLYRGQNFTAQIIEPVGIALALANCNHNGECPEPSQQLDKVLYAGPWNPTPHAPPNSYYQNFMLQVPEYIGTGPSIFTLMHLCLLGASPYPFLQFLNMSVKIEDPCIHGNADESKTTWM